MEDNPAKDAFSAQSAVFDSIYSSNELTNYMRFRVRKHVEKHLNKMSGILEINGGTGEDALYFASKGHRVLTTDGATGMHQKAVAKIAGSDFANRIEARLLDFADLPKLQPRKFDYVFSNFGGLNCTDKLPEVLAKISGLLNPGGKATLVIMPPFCVWESANLLKGNVKLATRRWAKTGAESIVEGHHFTSWYYTPGRVSSFVGKDMQRIDLEGLCTLVPPVYMERFIARYPEFVQRMKKVEARVSRWPGVRSFGDYYIITFQKK